ncbi:MAG: hypothetical protein ACFFCI_02245 [Promethearchaeota archaeon]
MQIIVTIGLKGLDESLNALKKMHPKLKLIGLSNDFPTDRKHIALLLEI